jgi:hypothetical protein
MKSPRKSKSKHLMRGPIIPILAPAERMGNASIVRRTASGRVR